MEKKRANIIMALIVLAVIIVITVVLILKMNDNQDEKVMRCIASKSKLYVLKSCPACAAQKEILGNYTSLFNMTDCSTEEGRQECTEQKITSVPSWIIDSTKYEGVLSIEDLKRLTGC